MGTLPARIIISKKIIYMLLMTAFVLLSCLPSVGSANVPTADFTGAPTKGCDSMQVQFTDASSGGDGALTYLWEFYSDDPLNIYINGEYGLVSSTEQNPSISFMHYSGTYSHAYANIRLTVMDFDVSVMLDGGYDTDFSTVTGVSAINGNMIITKGLS